MSMSENAETEALPEIESIKTSTHIFFGLCAATCVTFLIWSAIGTLDIVSMAQGEVIPSTQVKSIQHLEGGIVLEIMAREGQRVTQGQPLVTLEPTSSGAGVGGADVRVSSLRAEMARLIAEAEGKDKPAFPEDLSASRPELIAQS